MTNAPNRLTSLLRRLGVAGPARVGAFQGTSASSRSEGAGAPSSHQIFSQAGPDIRLADKSRHPSRPRDLISGPARRISGSCAALLCALVGAFACAAVAQAEPPALISYGSFSTQEQRAVGVAVEGS